MLTIDALKTYGADVNDGLARCMNNQDFYFRLIEKALEDKNFAALEDALANKDLPAAFEAAHSLKGVTGNLALTPIYSPILEMTELLREGKEIDYSDYLSLVMKKRDELKSLLAN